MTRPNSPGKQQAMKVSRTLFFAEVTSSNVSRNKEYIGLYCGETRIQTTTWEVAMEMKQHRSNTIQTKNDILRFISIFAGSPDCILMRGDFVLFLFKPLFWLKNRNNMLNLIMIVLTRNSCILAFPTLVAFYIYGALSDRNFGVEWKCIKHLTLGFSLIWTNRHDM